MRLRQVAGSQDYSRHIMLGVRRIINSQSQSLSNHCLNVINLEYLLPGSSRPVCLEFDHHPALRVPKRDEHRGQRGRRGEWVGVAKIFI